MLLAVDIGNTNITCGIFKGARLIKRFALPTRRYSLKALKKNLSGADIDAGIICSVVPTATNILKKGLTGFLGRSPYIIGKDIRVPIKNLYRCPGQVGQDRLVNAYAAGEFFGVPLVAVDFGTAITLDVVSSKKEYLGGMIIPGLRISLEGLYEHAALLPCIKPGPPPEFIGRDTRNSILSGVVYGFALLVDGFIAKIRKSLGMRLKVVGTGGNIAFMRSYCQQLKTIDPDLTLKGLNLLYRGRFSLTR